MRIRIVLGAVLAMAVAGCGDRVGTAGAGDVDLEGRWHLVSGTDAAGPLDLAGREVTLVVEGDEVGGTSACNHYFGQVTVDGVAVDVTGLGGTEMACEPPVMKLEQRYLAALDAVDRGVRSGDDLTLTGPEVTLDLSQDPPVQDAPLTGTVWRLTSLVEGETVSSVSAEARLVLGDDGTLEGSTGCRRVRARYTLDGGTVSVGRLEVEPGRCPPDARRQHQHVAAVLEGGFTATVEGARLSLVDESGAGLDLTAE